MQVNANQINAFLKNMAEDVRFALVYGYDEGQVRMISQSLQKAAFGAADVEIKHFDYAAVKSDPAMFFEEATALSLFTQRKIMLVDNCKEGFDTKIIEKLQNTRGVFVILQAGEMKKTTKLAKFFEARPDCVAIACYKDDAGTIADYIRNFFREQQVQFEQTVPMQIAQLLPTNRLILRNELEKLICYKDGDGFISEADVIEMFSPEGDLVIDKICLALGLRDRKALGKFVAQVEMYGGEFMLIVRSLQNYFYRALAIKTEMEQQNLSASVVIAKISPPVFFKQRESLAKVVESNSKAQFKNLVRKLLRLELQGKSATLGHSLLLGQFLLAQAESWN